jgi:hypothetical protein
MASRSRSWALSQFEFLGEGEGDRVGAIDSGVKQNVVQWRLGGRRMRQKSPIEVQHAQKWAELTGGLRRIAALEMGHSFFQRLGTIDGHLVTEEGDLGCSKDTLHWVDEDPVPLSVLPPVFDSKTVVLFLYVFSTSLPLRSEGMTC